MHDTVSTKLSPYVPKITHQELDFPFTTSPQFLLVQRLLQQSSAISYIQLFQLRVFLYIRALLC